MTSAIQSPSLLEKYDSTAFTQRLFRQEKTTETTSTVTDFATLLANLTRETDANATRTQNLFADLASPRAFQYGATYSATGAASRFSANTILIGYG